ncbi:MAG: MFS transporter, partial [Rhizomicrobium sp.]
TYYTMLRFHWTMKEVGLSMMALGLLTAIAYGGLTRLVIPRLGEVRSVYLGLSAGALAFAGYAFAATSWELYAWMPVFCLMALVMPSLNAMMSRSVDASQQGELQGALTSMGSLTSVVSPLFMTYIFAHFSRPQAPVYFPGAAFLVASLCLVAAIAAFAVLAQKKLHLHPTGQAQKLN